MKNLLDQNFEGQKVLVRVDFNVPLDEDFNITDDSRIKSVLPTLNKLKYNALLQNLNKVVNYIQLYSFIRNLETKFVVTLRKHFIPIYSFLFIQPYIYGVLFRNC